MIIAAAIRRKGLIFTLPPPARHHHIMHAMAEAGLPVPIEGDQGFLNSRAGFVDRELAAQVALADEQIPRLRFHERELFSEDLW